jgi:outer membrane lipoprotein-sorting protein
MKTLLIIATFITGSFYAQDTKAQGILDKLSAKMKGMKSFYVEFSATIKNSGTGVNETETGKGWIKGDKFYANYGDNTIICNGVKQWTVVKDEKTTYETDADETDEESINPKKLMTIWESGLKCKYDKEEKLGEEMVHVINLYPKDPKKAEYHTVTVYISKTSGDMKKAVMKRKDGTTMIYALTKFTANPTIEDTKFVYDSKKFPGYKTIKD